ncbi:hypothetical protein AZI98_07425 [Aeribacillus pallidus]|uniref:Uncharacterized protein n=1 Tax=Aeribacillus pallidus TaxID=33936 RepID=A0A165Y4K7_9BACI|nr:hypothetical protein AZI98_07425 [Aeribacillus pallidus]
MYAILFIFDNIYQYMSFILAFCFFTINNIFTAFFVKKIGEKIFLQKKYGYLFEIFLFLFFYSVTFSYLC